MPDIQHNRGAIVISRIVFAALLLALLLSGVHVVQSDEVAVTLRFGRLYGDNLSRVIMLPGIHFTFPPVIDEVIKVPVGRIRQVTVSTHYVSSLTISEDVAGTGYLVTGDQNIMLLEADVKYQIVDPLSYALLHANVEDVIKGVVSGVLREKVSETDVDSLLTTGKARLAEEAIADAQTRLDALSCGVYITNLDFTNVSPPSETIEDFEAVIAASIQKETLTQQALEYRVNAIPAAQSAARSLVDNASVARNEAISAAQNDVSAFIGLYEQYQLDPAIVIEGGLRERINALLSKMRVVITKPGEGAPRVILP
ncbi:MAG: protease modulator HflK [Oscillospiraceae bacterium]|jgi:membrane protease subunit HflK|nr:protease modulator HflK [Oscillospiraceae bacterium]